MFSDFEQLGVDDLAISSVKKLATLLHLLANLFTLAQVVFYTIVRKKVTSNPYTLHLWFTNLIFNFANLFISMENEKPEVFCTSLIYSNFNKHRIFAIFHLPLPIVKQLYLKRIWRSLGWYIVPSIHLHVYQSLRHSKRN